MNTPIDGIIQDLKDPGSLPDRTGSVQVVQTHISVVFVADHYVYKIKKPVDFGFLDFSTLEKRAFYCERERILNRRLARDIYLEVLPVRMEAGRYTLIPGSGEAVEYALKMRRIPEDRLMKSCFVRGDVTRHDIQRIAKVLARFHVSAETSREIDLFGRPDRFKINTDENFEQVAPYVGTTISREAFEDVKAWTEAFYRTQNSHFLKRIARQRIRDCHGDLHMEHICLTEDLPIIDCIEFNDRFRYGDTLSDIAFLLMDLEYHGGTEMAGTLWESYKKEAQEADADALVTFYKIYRAFVRGKVNSFQVNDPAISKTRKARQITTAHRYFSLAHSYIESQ